MPHAAAFHHHPHAGFYPRPPPKPRVRPNVGKFYHPRDHAASPFFRIVRDHFAEFEKVYPERFRHIYGFWRPVIRSSIEKFLKCGDLIHWHAHIHAIVPEGVFTSSGHFVHIPDIWQYRAVEIWQEHVFDLLLDECKITLEVAASMRAWKHPGFSVDTSVKIAGGDNDGMQHLVEYIARCPFSLARMISVAEDGKVFYRAGHPNCVPFPKTGDVNLLAGIPRNFEVFDPLEFTPTWMAAVNFMRHCELWKDPPPHPPP
nr:transposase [Chitinispirillaceae bacterium]